MFRSRLFFAFGGTLLAASLALGGCGGGGSDEDEPTEPAAEDTVEATAEATSEPAESDTMAVDQAFWHAGWKVTLGDATFTPDGAGGSVLIAAEFENLSDTTSTFNSQTVLTAAGESYEGGSLDEDLPEVPAGFSGEGALGFDVDESFSFDDAVLTIGNPDNNQAVIPIGEDADAELVTLEPIAIPVTGTVTAGAVTLTIEGAEVRADLPDLSDQLPKGTYAITINFSATPQAGIQVGQGVLQSPNVILRLPDGTAVAVRSDGVSGVNELLQGAEGTTISNLRVRYEIDEPIEGPYAVILRGNYGPGGAEVEGELAFTIEPQPSSTPAASGTGTPSVPGSELDY